MDNFNGETVVGGGMWSYILDGRRWVGVGIFWVAVGN